MKSIAYLTVTSSPSAIALRPAPGAWLDLPLVCMWPWMANVEQADLILTCRVRLDIGFAHRQRGHLRFVTIVPSDPEVIVLAIVEGLADSVVRAGMPAG